MLCGDVWSSQSRMCPFRDEDSPEQFFLAYLWGGFFVGLFRSLSSLWYQKDENQKVCFKMAWNSQMGHNEARVSLVFLLAKLDHAEVCVQPVPQVT